MNQPFREMQSFFQPFLCPIPLPVGFARPASEALLGLMSPALVAPLDADLSFLLGCEVMGTRQVEEDCAVLTESS